MSKTLKSIGGGVEGRDFREGEAVGHGQLSCSLVSSCFVFRRPPIPSCCGFLAQRLLSYVSKRRARQRFYSDGGCFVLLGTAQSRNTTMMSCGTRVFLVLRGGVGLPPDTLQNITSLLGCAFDRELRAFWFTDVRLVVGGLGTSLLRCSPLCYFFSTSVDFGGGGKWGRGGFGWGGVGWVGVRWGAPSCAQDKTQAQR